MLSRKGSTLWLSVFTLFLLLVLEASPSYAYSSSSPQTSLSATPLTPAQQSTVVSSGNNAYVTWPQKSGKNEEIYLAISRNGGQTWLPTEVLSASAQYPNGIPGKHNFERMYAVNQSVYVTWEVNANQSNPPWIIDFIASTDNGMSWGPVQTLTAGPINPSTCTYLCGQPTITAWGNNVYVTWAQNYSSNPSISGQTTMFVANDDSGAPGHWTPVQDIGNDELCGSFTSGSHSCRGSTKEQELATWGKYVYDTFYGAADYLQVSDNYGQPGSWLTNSSGYPTGQVLFSDNAGLGILGREVHIAVNGPNVCVTWEDNENLNNPSQTVDYQAFMDCSQNNGAPGSFRSQNATLGGEPIVTSAGLKGGSWLPLVFAGTNGTGFFYSAWGQINKGSWETYLSYSSNNGTSWSAPVALGAGYHPLIWANGSRVDVLYFSTSKGSYPFMTESMLNGQSGTWSTPINLSGGQGSAITVENDQPQIAFAANGNVTATWVESIGGFDQIFVSTSNGS